MKRFFTSFAVLAAFSVTKVVGDPLTYEVVGQTVTITYCKKSATGDLVIPATYAGKPVTSIGEAGFEDCRSLTNVTISDNVTSIGNEAFWGCSSLTSVTIPDSVTTVEQGLSLWMDLASYKIPQV